MKKLIAGNWKMNTTQAEALALAGALAGGLDGRPLWRDVCDVLLCPPFVHIAHMKNLLDASGVLWGAQDCSAFDSGAYTGDISAFMLRDYGCSHVILGHSERRANHNEKSALIAQKAAQAHKSGLTAIICVGESEGQRDEGQELDVVGQQIEACLPLTAHAANTVIAYEPIWAIGTGKTAMPDDVITMHGFIREKLKEKIDAPEKLRILYGGSMKPENAAELLACQNVDGGLIGGASLQADSFLAIVQAALARAP